MNSYIGIFFCLIAILILQKIETSNQFHEKNGSDHLLGCREQDMSIFVNGILWKYLSYLFTVHTTYRKNTLKNARAWVSMDFK